MIFSNKISKFGGTSSLPLPELQSVGPSIHYAKWWLGSLLQRLAVVISLCFLFYLFIKPHATHLIEVNSSGLFCFSILLFIIIFHIISYQSGVFWVKWKEHILQFFPSITGSNQMIEVVKHEKQAPSFFSQRSWQIKDVQSFDRNNLQNIHIHKYHVFMHLKSLKDV